MLLSTTIPHLNHDKPPILPTPPVHPHNQNQHTLPVPPFKSPTSLSLTNHHLCFPPCTHSLSPGSGAIQPAIITMQCLIHYKQNTSLRSLYAGIRFTTNLVTDTVLIKIVECFLKTVLPIEIANTRYHPLKVSLFLSLQNPSLSLPPYASCPSPFHFTLNPISYGPLKPSCVNRYAEIR